MDDLEFLKPYKVDGEMFSLSAGVEISIQKYFLHFNEWNGEPVFAELAVLRLFQSHGWEGVWVDSYRRKYRIGLPDVAESIELPDKQRQLLDSVRAKTERHGGCWDVLVWKDDQLLFIELKRSKKDRVQESQISWLEKSVSLGLKAENFAFVEGKIME